MHERRSGIVILWGPPLEQGAHLDEGCFQRARLRLTTGMRTLHKTHNLPVVQELLGQYRYKTTAMFYTAATGPRRQAMEETRGSGLLSAACSLALAVDQL